MASPPPTTSDATTPDITIPNLPRSYQSRCDWIRNERLVIQRFAQASKKANGPPDPKVHAHRDQLHRIRLLLNLLEYDFDISPAYRRDTQIDIGLQLTFTRPEYHFPEDVKRRAEALFRRWEEANWGEAEAGAEAGAGAGAGDPDEDTEGNDDGGPPLGPGPGPTPLNRTTAPGTGTAIIRRPPPHHPVWGIIGIMHGVMAVTGGRGRRYQRLDTRFHRRSAGVPGHNGLTPGAWWPTQMVALFWGAHGHCQAGISGNEAYGAYSIVVAGTYKDVDDDRGEIIYYSGPGSQTNEDRTHLPSGQGTSHLQRSLDTGNPVRVLRRGGANPNSSSSNRSSAYAPSVGIRYDGLYRVVEQEQPFRRNSSGGLYTRYVLRRIPNQESLVSLRARSPSARQMRDFGRIWDLW